MVGEERVTLLIEVAGRTVPSAYENSENNNGHAEELEG